YCFFFFQAEDGIRDFHVTGVQTCALPICTAGDAPGTAGAAAPAEPAQASGAEAVAAAYRTGSEGGQAAPAAAPAAPAPTSQTARSEERRVGKECSSRWRP